MTTPTPQPFAVQTQHQVVPIGADRMELRDNSNAATIATATRTDASQPWQVDINVDGATGFTATNRTDAVSHMIHDRPDVDPTKPGFSTQVPHGYGCGCHADLP